MESAEGGGGGKSDGHPCDCGSESCETCINQFMSDTSETSDDCITILELSNSSTPVDKPKFRKCTCGDVSCKECVMNSLLGDTSNGTRNRCIVREISTTTAGSEIGSCLDTTDSSEECLTIKEVKQVGEISSNPDSKKYGVVDSGDPNVSEDQVYHSFPRICIDNTKIHHPRVTAEADDLLCTDDKPVIRLSLRKPRHWKWELTASSSSSDVALPVIHLLDEEGEVLVDTTERQGASHFKYASLPVQNKKSTIANVKRHTSDVSWSRKYDDSSTRTVRKSRTDTSIPVNEKLKKSRPLSSTNSKERVYRDDCSDSKIPKPSSLISGKKTSSDRPQATQHGQEVPIIPKKESRRKSKENNSDKKDSIRKSKSLHVGESLDVAHTIQNMTQSLIRRHDTYSSQFDDGVRKSKSLQMHSTGVESNKKEEKRPIESMAVPKSVTTLRSSRTCSLRRVNSIRKSDSLRSLKDNSKCVGNTVIGKAEICRTEQDLSCFQTKDNDSQNRYDEFKKTGSFQMPSSFHNSIEKRPDVFKVNENKTLLRDYIVQRTRSLGSTKISGDVCQPYGDNSKGTRKCQFDELVNTSSVQNKISKSGKRNGSLLQIRSLQMSTDSSSEDEDLETRNFRMRESNDSRIRSKKRTDNLSKFKSQQTSKDSSTSNSDVEDTGQSKFKAAEEEIASLLKYSQKRKRHPIKSKSLQASKVSSAVCSDGESNSLKLLNVDLLSGRRNSGCSLRRTGSFRPSKSPQMSRQSSRDETNKENGSEFRSNLSKSPINSIHKSKSVDDTKTAEFLRVWQDESQRGSVCSLKRKESIRKSGSYSGLPRSETESQRGNNSLSGSRSPSMRRTADKHQLEKQAGLGQIYVPPLPPKNTESEYSDKPSGFGHLYVPQINNDVAESANGEVRNILGAQQDTCNEDESIKISQEFSSKPEENNRKINKNSRIPIIKITNCSPQLQITTNISPLGYKAELSDSEQVFSDDFLPSCTENTLSDKNMQADVGQINKKEVLTCDIPPSTSKNTTEDKERYDSCSSRGINNEKLFGSGCDSSHKTSACSSYTKTSDYYSKDYTSENNFSRSGVSTWDNKREDTLVQDEDDDKKTNHISKSERTDSGISCPTQITVTNHSKDKSILSRKHNPQDIVHEYDTFFVNDLIVKTSAPTEPLKMITCNIPKPIRLHHQSPRKIINRSGDTNNLSSSDLMPKSDSSTTSPGISRNIHTSSAVPDNQLLKSANIQPKTESKLKERRKVRGRLHLRPAAINDSSTSPTTPKEGFRRRRRKKNKLQGDRLVQINGRPINTFREASQLLGSGSDLLHLRFAHRRHDSGPASPRRSQKRRHPHAVSKEAGEEVMGSNVSRHSGKGLSGRRTQSSGNLCNGNKILAPSVGRLLAPCSGGGVGAKDRNKFCGSLPNHLDVNSDESPAPTPCNNNSQTLKNQRNVELRLHALDPTTLHDQGYGSERSPEEEQPPGVKGWMQYPFITPDATYSVSLLKGSRGLGLSVTGGVDTHEQWPGLVRIKRLFPHQPAWQSGHLCQGDILLAANGVPLVGLTNYQALEVLRKTPSNVVLTVCRPPSELCCLQLPSDPPPPPPPPRRDLSHTLLPLPLPPIQTEAPTGEFDINLTKVNRSLGFTLRKEDDSALGHYVRALVREPALSDGRIRPGDKIVAVNDVDISPMSHEEAVMFLRQCGDMVKLRLYRDAAQTPVSALSPTEEAKSFRPKPLLRKEAMDMLSDLAVRKLSPGDSSGSSYSKLRRVSDGQSSSPCSSPRRRRLTKTPSPDICANTLESECPTTGLVKKYLTSSLMGTSDSSEERSSLDSTRARGHASSFASTADSTEGDVRPTRPNFLDLCGDIGAPGTSRKQKFTFTVASTGEEEWDSLAPTSESEDLATNTTLGSVSQYYSNSSEDCADNGNGGLSTEPASMPPLTNLSSTSSTSTAFSYRNPAYQSAHPGHPVGLHDGMKKGSDERASDQDIPGRVFACRPGTGVAAEGSRGLLKWKGVVFTPETDEVESGNLTSGTEDSSSQVTIDKEHTDQVFMVELTRGWNSRLGFSLQGDGNHTFISAIYADSVAAKDGRLQAGDQVLMVNDESVEEMSTADVIDLLRKIRGTIGITVLRKRGPNTQAS